MAALAERVRALPIGMPYRAGATHQSETRANACGGFPDRNAASHVTPPRPAPLPPQSLAQQRACRASTACRYPDRRYGRWTPSPDSPRSSTACFHSLIARRFCMGDMIRNSFILPRKSFLDFSGSVAKSSNITKTFTM
ncbi:hypothetical protein G3O06_00390 [Burkholderia sp. Ac-20345]|nr:hypothetical protein [Burkholderia sp. Ac-20345]